MSGPDARMIIEFFNREAPSMGINQEALNNPQTDQLIQAYHFICDLIFEDLDTVKILDIGSDPVMARPLMIVRTQQYVNLFFNKVHNGEHEFCYTDLVQPDPRRNKAFLAMLIRFYNLKCDLAKAIQSVDNDIDELQHANDFEKTCLQKTCESLRRCKETLSQMDDKKEDMQNKEWRLNEKLEEKKGKVDDEKREIGRIKELLNEAQSINDEHRQKLSQEEDNRRRLEMNIVNSPDRLLAELGHMESELAIMRQKHDQAIQNSRKFDRELGEQRVTWQCVEGLSSELRKLDVMQERMVEMRGSGEEHRKKLNELELMRKILVADLDQLTRQSETEMKSLQSEVHGQRKAIEAIQQQKTQLERDEKELAKRLATTKDNIREHQQLIKRKERSVIITTEQYDEAVAKMFKDVANLKKKVDEERQALDKFVDEKVCNIYPHLKGLLTQKK